MDSKELRLFKEAYGSVYTSQTEKLQESVEELDETAMREDPRMKDRKKPAPTDGKKSRPLPTPMGGRKEMPEPNKKTDQLPQRTKENARNVEYYKDDVDLFDIVKGHLMSEGFADTEEAALAIMANMSEEWRHSIVEKAVPSGKMIRNRKDLPRPGIGNAAERAGSAAKKVLSDGERKGGGKKMPASYGKPAQKQY